MKRRRLPLNSFEDGTLKWLYLVRRIPVDRYDHRPSDLRELTRDFNGLTDRQDSSDEILHYMRTMRKKRLWVRFDGNHLRLSAIIGDKVAADKVPVLCKIYSEIGLGLDNYSYYREKLTELEKCFFEETGIKCQGPILVGALTELRKAGVLPKVGPTDKGEFNDFDAAEGIG